MGELAELVEPKAKNRSEFIQECRSGRLDNVLVTFRQFASISVTGLWDEELIKELPKSLKFVCHNGEYRVVFDYEHFPSLGPEITVSVELICHRSWI